MRGEICGVFSFIYHKHKLSTLKVKRNTHINTDPHIPTNEVPVEADFSAAFIDA